MTKRGNRPPSQRQLRIGEELRHALSEILERESFHDPALNDARITVTEVRVGPDLRQARVYVVPLGGAGADAAVTALTRAKPFLRRLVAAAVQLKFVPDLSFHVDWSFDEAARIDTLFKDPAVARDLAPLPDPAEDGHDG